MDIHFLLLLAGLVLFASVLFTRFTSKIGVPILVVFLFLGIFLDTGRFVQNSISNYNLVQSISIFALITIMFSGGLDTSFGHIKPVLKEGISLSTVGVFITFIVVGLSVHYIFNMDLMLSLLLGATVSSTDAAAVFSIFRTQNMKIKYDLDNILELESGTNDPMAYIIVISIIHLILHPQTSMVQIVIQFIVSLVVGFIGGALLGKGLSIFLARLKLPIEGLYPVLLVSAAILSYAITEYFGGNGFLAVYIAGIIIGNCKIKYKELQLSFFDGFAWVMQIIMFILLGAFTDPSELLTVFVPALIISIVLIFVARPIAVLITLAPFKLNMRAKTFISWAGVKGAIPIVFAFYPLVAQIPDAMTLLNTVMVITCMSVLLQGSTLKVVAKHLNLLN
ncbi:potassium/proton antiporter [Methanobrevibacter sp.]|uniref:potassium/proton antiporter n=1 Tax=Methanobrevibacter sp. TaxID=66852 RepID=UPI0026E0A588|nr:potassium/proton antiporter [Methanobrevibacter sp.]